MSLFSDKQQFKIKKLNDIKKIKFSLILNNFRKSTKVHF